MLDKSFSLFTVCGEVYALRGSTYEEMRSNKGKISVE